MTDKELYSELYKEREKKKELLKTTEKKVKNPAREDFAMTLRTAIADLDKRLSEIDERLTREEKKDYPQEMRDMKIEYRASNPDGTLITDQINNENYNNTTY